MSGVSLTADVTYENKVGGFTPPSKLVKRVHRMRGDGYHPF